MTDLQRYNGNFAQCLAQIMKAGQTPATAKQVMRDRIKQGVKSDSYSKGTWIPENFNVVDGRILAARPEYNPLLKYAEQAVNCHRNNKEFYLTNNILLNENPASLILSEIAEQDAKKAVKNKRVYDMGKSKTHDVPTDSLADDKGIVFLAQGEKLAKEYGLFLKNEAGLPNVTFYLPLLSNKDYSRGLWLYSVAGDGSNFDGYNRSLNSDYGFLFGVRNSAEGTQKNLQVPTLKQIIEASKPFVSDDSRENFEARIRKLYKA